MFSVVFKQGRFSIIFNNNNNLLNTTVDFDFFVVMFGNGYEVVFEGKC